MSSSVTRAVGAQLARRGQAEEDREAALRSIEGRLHLIIDDGERDTIHFPPSWSVNRDSQWYQGTETRFEGNGPGTFDVLLYGTELSLIGIAPLASEGHTFLVSVDGGDPFEAHFQGDDLNSTYRTWYTLSDFQGDNEHTGVYRITFSNLPSGTSLDYAVRIPHDNTNVDAKRLAIVDDSDPMMVYTGSWGPRNDVGSPYNSSVMASSTVGDSVTVKFLGTSASFYGLFEATGTVSASYSIDSSFPTTLSYASSSSITQNGHMHSFSNLAVHLHTLTITITESTNDTALMIDYFTYAPSFGSVEWLRQGRGIAGGELANGPVKRMSAGATAGMVVGILCAVFVLIGIFCCRGSLRCSRSTFRRRKNASKGSRKESGEHGTSSAAMREKFESSRSPYFAFKTPATASTLSLDAARSSVDLARPRRSSTPPVYLNTVVRPPISSSDPPSLPPGSGSMDTYSPALDGTVTPFDSRNQPSTSAERMDAVGQDKKTKVGGDDEGKITPFDVSAAPAPQPNLNCKAAVKAELAQAKARTKSESHSPAQLQASMDKKRPRLDVAQHITPFELMTPSPSSSRLDSKAALKAMDDEAQHKITPFDTRRLSVQSTSSTLDSYYMSGAGGAKEKERRTVGSKIAPEDRITPFVVHSSSGSPHSKKSKEVSEGLITPFSVDEKPVSPSEKKPKGMHSDLITPFPVDSVPHSLSSKSKGKLSAVVSENLITPFPTNMSPSLSSSKSKSKGELAITSHPASRHDTSDPSPSPVAASPDTDVRHRRRRESLQARLDHLLAETERAEGPIDPGKIDEMKGLVKEIERLAREIVQRARARRRAGEGGFDEEEEELPPYEMEIGVAM